MKKYFIFVVFMLGVATLILFSGLTLPIWLGLLLLILAVSLDFLTTLLCLRKKGREGNPAIAFLFRKMTVPGTFILLVAIWVCFIIFRWIPSSPGIQAAVALSYWLVPVNNVIVLAKLNRKLKSVQVTD